MKSVSAHIIFTFTITIIFGLFFIMGFSKTAFYISAAILASIAVIEAGRKYGFNKKLPKVKASEGNIHLMRIAFGIILLSMANRIMAHDLIDSLLNSKSFIVVLWSWIVIEVLIDGFREYQNSKNSNAGI